MDLDQIIDSVVPPAARGRREKAVSAVVRRELNSSDIEALWALPEGGLNSEANPLKKLRYQHHMLAKLLAEGRAQEEAAMITGYSPSYISSVKGDPAMQDLIEYYKTQVDEVYVNVHERLAALGLNTVEELQDRLAEEPDKFTNRELMELSALTLDRSGHGPSSKVQHDHTHSISPTTISRIKAESASRQQGTLRAIDPQSYSRPQVGGPIIDGEAAPNALERLPSEGDNLSEQNLPEPGGEVLP